MADTDLVVLNNNPTYTQPEEDNGNWGDDEVSLPEFVQIKQNLTEGQDHLAAGTLFTKTGQVWEGNTIKGVILKMNKTRQWKPSSPKFIKDEKTLCRSEDGKIPVTTDERLIPQAKSCLNDSCPKNSWKGYDKVTKQGSKPVCNPGFFIFFIDEETELPYILNASGQGVDPSLAMFDAMRARAKVEKAKTGKMPSTFDYSVSFTSEKGNKAFRLKFLEIRRLKPEDSAKFGPLYEKFIVAYENKNLEPVVDGDYVAEDTGAVDEPDEFVAA
jgi:hypothetical protein